MESVSKLQQIIADLQAAEHRLLGSSTDMTTNSAPSNSFQGSGLNNSHSHLPSKKDYDELLAKNLDLEEKNVQMKSEIISLTDDNRRLAQELYDAQKESILKSKINETLLTEQDILISKLHQVQEELESYYIDKIALEATLKESTSFLNDVRMSIVNKVEQSN